MKEATACVVLSLLTVAPTLVACKSIDESSIEDEGSESETEVDWDSDVADIGGLTRLVSAGEMAIWACPNLQKLDGIENLAYVYGDLQLIQNASLGIDLPSLRYVGKRLRISDETLTAIGGLENLVAVGELEIYKSPKLESLEGLESLLHVYGTLKINDNASLRDLGALSNLTSVTCL